MLIFFFFFFSLICLLRAILPCRPSPLPPPLCMYVIIADARFLHFELTHAYFDIHTPFFICELMGHGLYCLFTGSGVLVALSTHVLIIHNTSGRNCVLTLFYFCLIVRETGEKGRV